MRKSYTMSKLHKMRVIQGIQKRKRTLGKAKVFFEEIDGKLIQVAKYPEHKKLNPIPKKF